MLRLFIAGMRARGCVRVCMHVRAMSLTSVQAEVPLFAVMLVLDLLWEFRPDELPETVVHQGLRLGGGAQPRAHPEPAERTAQAVVLERALQAAQAEVMCARQRHWLDQDAAAHRAHEIPQTHVRAGPRQRQIEQFRRAFQVCRHLSMFLLRDYQRRHCAPLPPSRSTRRWRSRMGIPPFLCACGTRGFVKRPERRNGWTDVRRAACSIHRVDL